MDEYGSKIQKVGRWRPTISNETILAIKQEFFFTKAAPVQSITDIAILGFLINTASLNVYFILHYHLFFRKDFFFECLYFSEYDIQIFLLVFGWEMSYPLSTYATGGMEVASSKMYTSAYRERELRNWWMDGPKQMLWNTFCALVQPCTLEYCQQGKCCCFLPS